MRPGASAALLCAALLMSQLVLAESEARGFEAKELKSIRSISQAILKVRGQERSDVLEKTQALRRDVSEIRAQLELMAAELDRPSLVIREHNTQFSAAEPLTKGRALFWERLMSYFSRSAADDNDSEGERSRTSTDGIVHVQKAREIIANRKAMLEAEQPAFWEILRPVDRKNEHVRNALTKLEDDIEKIPEMTGVKKREHIKALIRKLEGNPQIGNNKPPVEIAPTITSITRHYRK